MSPDAKSPKRIDGICVIGICRTGIYPELAYITLYVIGALSMRKLTKEEKIVKSYFESIGLKVEPLEESKEQGKKNPDFSLCAGTAKEMFCEVKTIFRPSLPEEPIKTSTVYNKLTSDIDQAIVQLESRNRLRSHPNILAWVCDDPNHVLSNLVDLHQKKVMTNNNEELFEIERKFWCEPRYSQFFKIDLHVCIAFDGGHASYFPISKYMPHVMALWDAFPPLAEIESGYSSSEFRFGRVETIKNDL